MTDIELHDGPGELWQESMFVAWFDLERGFGGAHRVGHEVTRGRSNEWSALFGPDGQRWRRLTETAPLHDDNRRAQRFGSGFTAFVSDGGAMGLRLDADDAEADLRFEDFYQPTPVWNGAEAYALAQTIAPSHLEASGRVTGTIRIGDVTTPVDGMFHRDHSWGARDWSTIRSHRWVAGSLGADFSFSSVILQVVGNRYITGGAVVRHGAITYAEDVDIVTWSEPDGASHRGGTLRMKLSDGEQIMLHLEAVDGVVFSHDGWVGTEVICRARLDGSDAIGFCDFEMSNGLAAVPTAALRAIAVDGLSQR